MEFMFFQGQNQTEPGVGVYSIDKMVIDGGPFPQATPSGPYFDPENSGNVSVISEAKAVLNCRVFNIGNRTVSSAMREYPPNNVTVPFN